MNAGVGECFAFFQKVLTDLLPSATVPAIMVKKNQVGRRALSAKEAVQGKGKPMTENSIPIEKLNIPFVWLGSILIITVSLTFWISGLQAKSEAALLKADEASQSTTVMTNRLEGMVGYLQSIDRRLARIEGSLDPKNKPYAEQ